MKEKLMKNLQAFGKSLLLPITILAAVGIIVGLTASLNREAVADLLPFMQNEVISYILLSIRSLSLNIFGLIPVLFAISIAFGMAKKEQGVAALAGFVSYYTMLASASYMIGSNFIDYPTEALGSVFGLSTVNMEAFGGIIAGLIAVWAHNRYCELKLPTAIAFFGGKRSVAIITIAIATIVGQILPFVWLPISNAITSFGLAIDSMGLFGTFLYGFGENALVPTGLHHVFIAIFRTTEVGGTLEVAGETFVGAWNSFFGGFGNVPTEQLGEYTRYLSQGRIPVFMFGFPGAALAMYKTAAEERRAALKPLLIAGVLAIFVTGIQEPLVFLFLFTAPLLFAFNAVMCGVSFMLMDLFDVVIGNTQGGVIDLLVYGVFVEGSNWIYAFITGICMFALYYFVFSWYIKKKNVLIAPGVEEEEEEEEATSVNAGKSGNPKALKIIQGLGGSENIVEVNNCFTRLRVDVKDMEALDDKLLMSTGAVGINKVSKEHEQVIYGPKVDVIATQVKTELGR